MPDTKGWLTKEEATVTGLPLFIKTERTKPGRWTQEPYGHAVLLTKTRCAQLKMPTLDSGREAAVAYRYAQGASSSYRYVPLYDRTSVFESGDLPFSILRDGEIMGSRKYEGR